MQPFDGNQTRTFINTVQLYESFRDAFKSTRPFKGGMSWKRVRNTVYLFRTRDRYGNGKTMGVRSPETEEAQKRFRLLDYNGKAIDELCSIISWRAAHQYLHGRQKRVHGNVPPD